MPTSPPSRHHKSRSGGVSPLIDRILRNEEYFGNGPPVWPDAPSSRDAEEARITHVKRLRRFAGQFPEAKALAKILTRCKPRRRCMSGACPECTRAFQRWFVSEVVAQASNNGDDLNSISVIFLKHRTAEDQLNTLVTAGMKRSMSEIVKSPGSVWMAGAVDLSLNDDTQKGQGIFWQPQLYVIADADLSGLAKALRDRFSPTETARRPVQIKSCDGSETAASYAFKTEFVRRIAYQAEVGPPDDRRKCWHTRKVSLRPAEHVQALLWRHEIGLHGRLFLHGVRMTRNGNGVGLAQIKKLE